MAGTCTHLGKLIGSFFTSRHWCLWLLVHSGCPWTKDAIAAMPVARQKERPTNYFSPISSVTVPRVFKRCGSPCFTSSCSLMRCFPLWLQEIMEDPSTADECVFLARGQVNEYLSFHIIMVIHGV